MATQTLQPLPAPGLALFPKYLSTTQLTILLKGSTFSRNLTATLLDGTPLFIISSTGNPISRRQAVIDTATQTTLFQVHRAGGFSRAYYADDPTTGLTLFDIQTQAKLFSRARNAVSFANQADVTSGTPTVELDYVAPMTGNNGSMTYNGQLVAVIERVGLSVGGEHHVHIAPGLDPSVVVGVVIAMIDRSRKRMAATSASIGGAS